MGYMAILCLTCQGTINETVPQRRYTNGQQMREKTLSISHSGNVTAKP